MSAPTVVITGANGFVGSALMHAFEADGWRAIGAGRHGCERAYDLTWTQLPPELLDGAGALVHAAYVKNDYRANVAGSELLLDEAHRHGVERIAFLSSLAAHDGALSSYGRQKLALERRFARDGALVVRPGLVLGAGSIFGATCEYLHHHRFVPVIGGGKQPMQTVFVGELAEAVVTAVEHGVRGVFTVAEVEPVAFMTFYRELARQLGVAPAFVPVPFWAADAALRAAGLLRLSLPIDRDNLLGLRAMVADRGPFLQTPSGAVSDYRRNIALALA